MHLIGASIACVCVLFVCCQATEGLFERPCPPGCAVPKCYSHGCNWCLRGYCKYYSPDLRISTCVPEDQCGEGKYCETRYHSPFCTACGSNCED